MKPVIRRLFAAILALTLLVTSASALSVEEALALLDAAYLRDIPEQARQAETLDELFALLGDPYTYYMDEEEYYDFLYAVEGTEEVVGIGVSVQFTGEGVLITDTLSGGSAEAAGLQSGDLIVAVDGVSCIPADETHQALITGPIGTYVTITVLRDGVERDYTLMRRQVIIHNTTFSMLEGGIGYIDCNSFGSDTGDLISEFVSGYDAEADHWLLDLRSNSGGYTNTAVTAAGVFCGPGAYLFLRDKLGYTEYYVHAVQALTEDSLIVLVNGSSASASEALAAAVRDTGRGIIVGSRTFGKGVAQILLDDETYPELFSGDGLKITSYRFYSALGSTTDQIGVIPTLLLSDLYAPAVARALSGTFRDDLVTEGQLMLAIADQYFFIDLDSMSPDAASAFLSALPPSARLYAGVNTYNWDEITFGQAAELLGAAYTSRWFTDLADSPYADEINTLATYRLLLGDGTGKYLPDGQFTRAQLCAMLAQLMGLTYTGPSRFTDVADSAWYADEVNAMAALGFVEGAGDGLFRPNDTLSQQEFFTILGRMARHLNLNVDDYAYTFYAEDGTCLLDHYPELDAFAHWAKEDTAILAWSSEALAKGGSMLFADLTELEPTAPILREEAAACLYRMLSILGIIPA